MSNPPLVDPAAPEAVFMAQRKPHGAVPAHAQTGDGPSAAIGARMVTGVYVAEQFLRYEGFVTHRRIDGAVPVPAVLAVRAYDDHAVAFGQLYQFGFHLQPIGGIAAVTVQQVEHRVGRPRFRPGAVGYDYHHFDSFVHRRAPDRQRIHGRGLRESGRK